jgi:predicted nuclease of predicted toxin-antitoxin system
VKFYVDEDLTPAIATGLRRKGVDAVSAHEVGNVGIGDEEQLEFATRRGRCLVSRNARDFGSLGRDAVAQRRPHAGIILCPPSLRGADVGAVVAALVKVADQYSRGLGEYDVLYL